VNEVKSKIIWLLVALIGATAFAVLALSRGEPVNAAWLVLAAVSCYAGLSRPVHLHPARRPFTG